MLIAAVQACNRNRPANHLIQPDLPHPCHIIEQNAPHINLCCIRCSNRPDVLQ